MTVGSRDDVRPVLHLWIAGQVRNDGVSCLACGYCLEASMTGRLYMDGGRCYRPSGLRIKSAVTVEDTGEWRFAQQDIKDVKGILADIIGW